MLSVFHRKDLVLLNQISRNVTFRSEELLKSKDIVDLCKVNNCISKLFTQCNAGSCCMHVASGVSISLSMCQSIGLCVCSVCLHM